MLECLEMLLVRNSQYFKTKNLISLNLITLQDEAEKFEVLADILFLRVGYFRRKSIGLLRSSLSQLLKSYLNSGTCLDLGEKKKKYVFSIYCNNTDLVLCPSALS